MAYTTQSLTLIALHKNPFASILNGALLAISTALIEVISAAVGLTAIIFARISVIIAFQLAINWVVTPGRRTSISPVLVADSCFRGDRFNP